MYYLIAVIVGIFVGFGISTVQKSALTSVSMQHAAADYIKKNSLKFRVSTDTFMYKKLEKTAKPQNQK